MRGVRECAQSKAEDLLKICVQGFDVSVDKRYCKELLMTYLV